MMHSLALIPRSFLLLIVIFCLTAASPRCQAIVQDPTPPDNNSPAGQIEFGFLSPDITNAQARARTGRIYREVGATLFRLGVDWEQVEQSKGNYNWTTLDQATQWLHDNNIKLLLTIKTSAPAWAVAEEGSRGATINPENVPDFEEFVRLLLERYEGKIDAIQFGNEWQADTFYPGSAEQFAALNNRIYAVVKEHSPETPFVLGGFSTRALRLLGVHTGTLPHLRENRTMEVTPAGQVTLTLGELQQVEKGIYVLENAQYDVIDLHLYFDIDDWDEHVQTIRQYDSTTPLIVSEWGATHPVWSPEPTDAVLAENMSRALEKLVTLPIEQAYHLKIDIGAPDVSDLFRYCGITNEEDTLPLLYETYRSFMAAYLGLPGGG